MYTTVIIAVDKSQCLLGGTAYFMDHAVFCNSIETVESHFKKKESHLSGGKKTNTEF